MIEKPITNEQNIAGRHTKRSDGISGLGNLEIDDLPSDNYLGVTIEGERKARETARRQYKELIDYSAPNAILFIGGSSEEDRTCSTGEIIGEELENIYADDPSIMVITKKKIESWQEEDSEEDKKINNIKILSKLQNIIEANPDKKIIIAYPLYLKEISLRPFFRSPINGEHTQFSQEIIKQAGQDEFAATKLWFACNGRIKIPKNAVSIVSKGKSARIRLEGVDINIKKDNQKLSEDEIDGTVYQTARGKITVRPDGVKIIEEDIPETNIRSVPEGIIYPTSVGDILLNGDEQAYYTTPTPQKLAEAQLAAFARLRNFSRQFAAGREIDLAIIGHGWQMDALMVYLANNGQVNAEAYNRLFSDQPLEQAEAGRWKVNNNGMTFEYRGRSFSVNHRI